MLNDLEVAFQFPVGDRILELTPFPFTRLHEMIDKLGAEQFARDFGALEVLGGFRERARQARNVPRVGAVAFERRRGELEPVLDTVQA